MLSTPTNFAFAADKPIGFEADNVVVNQADGSLFATGNVELKQANNTLRADEVTYYRNQNKAIARGNVVHIDGDGTVTNAAIMEIDTEFSHFVPSNTRWIGTASGCSDPLPDFTEVNNRDRMVTSAKMAGGIVQSPDMSWLVNGAAQTDDPAVMINDKQYAVLIPGCSLAKPQKRWPADKFAAIGNELAVRGIEIVLVGTADDRDAVNAVLAASPDAIDLCGKTNLARLARLLGGAAFVIGNDTGPMFLAARTGVPSLMIMGPDTDPTMSAPNGAATSWLQGAPISKISAIAAIDALESLGLKPNA